MGKNGSAGSWERYFAVAQEYASRHGTLAIGKTVVVDGIPLGRWLDSQRQKQSAGRLSQEQEARLEAIGMVWRIRDAHWERMYQGAREYAREQGHLEVPKGYLVDGHDLAQWLAGCRARAASLPPERRKRLEEIGLSFDKRTAYRRACWEQGYARAVVYFQRNGHLYVPEAYLDDARYTLGRWIRSQRAGYRHGRLSLEQIQRLEAIGMVWRVEQRVQTSFAEQAIFYYLKKLFPDGENQNRSRCGCELDIYIPSLGLAVEYDSLSFHGPAKADRDLAKNRQCRGKVFLVRVRHRDCPYLGENDAFVHYLYYDQEDQLERVIRELLELVHSRYGTDIRPAAVDLERDRAAISEQLSSRVDYLWRRKLADAQAFYREHGHLDIPYGYMVRGYNLGSWLQDQRKAYGQHRLTSDKVQALEAMGIKWRYLDETWNAYYEQVKEHYQRHGHTRFSPGSKAERPLFHWKHDQIKLLRNHSIDQDRAALLAGIGITAAYTAEGNFEQMCRRVEAFRRENGHSLVPVNHSTPDGVPLGKWLQRQRGLLKQGKLSPERLARLKEAGFCPHLHQERFWQWVELLKVYRRDHGDLLVPQACVLEGKLLGKFVNKTRVEYRRGRLDPERVAVLEELGMVWYIAPGDREAKKAGQR